jgi:hypothetical protein
MTNSCTAERIWSRARLKGSLVLLLCILIVVLGIVACDAKPSLPGHGLLAFVVYQGWHPSKSDEGFNEQVYQVYLFNPDNWDARLLSTERLLGGGRVVVLWSPHSSYLAIVRHNYSTGGVCSVWDTTTLTYYKPDVWPAGHLLWSPDERYFVVEIGSPAHDCWSLQIWTGDGSSLVLDTPRAVCAEGDNIGYRPVRWTEDNRLLVNYREYYSADLPSGQYLVNPQDGEWIRAGDLTRDMWREQRGAGDEGFIVLWDNENDLLSTDGALRAIADDSSLAIIEVSSGQVFSVPLPANTVQVEYMMWSP